MEPTFRGTRVLGVQLNKNLAYGQVSKTPLGKLSTLSSFKVLFTQYGEHNSCSAYGHLKHGNKTMCRFNVIVCYID